MLYTVNSKPDNLSIILTGHLTFSDNSTFKSMIEQIEQSLPQALTLNFDKVDFIDSAGLGMLLLLRDLCHEKNIFLTIRAIHGQVKKIFAMSNFDQLFKIQP